MRYINNLPRMQKAMKITEAILSPNTLSMRYPPTTGSTTFGHEYKDVSNPNSTSETFITDSI